MAEFVYILCALTSSACGFLLLRQYRRARTPLLFWSAVCFLILTASNILLFIDLVIFPAEVSLALWRNILSTMATVFMLYGLIHRTVEK